MTGAADRTPSFVSAPTRLKSRLPVIQIMHQLKAMELNAWVRFALAVAECLMLGYSKNET